MIILSVIAWIILVLVGLTAFMSILDRYLTRKYEEELELDKRTIGSIKKWKS